MWNLYTFPTILLWTLKNSLNLETKSQHQHNCGCLSPKVSKTLIYSHYWGFFQLPWVDKNPGGSVVPCFLGRTIQYQSRVVTAGICTKPCALEAGSSVASGQSLGTKTLPISESSTPRGLISLSLNRFIPSFPVAQMQTEKTQRGILIKHIFPISPCLRDADKIAWGGVCESVFSTVGCWTLEELQLWEGAMWGLSLSLPGVFPPIANTWLFPWVEHEMN